MWARRSFLTALYALSPLVHGQNYSEGRNSSSGVAWHWAGPDGDDGGYWFTQAQGAVQTMQDNYWNGTYWPTTIQWIGAVLDTILASTTETFSDALIEYNGDVPNTSTSSSAIQSDIEKYFSQIEAYYTGEDTSEILGDAYDDVQWVVLEWLEAIKAINRYSEYAPSNPGKNDIAKFAHQAHIFYNVVHNKFDTSLCEGGLDWNPKLAPYKNAITNELFIATSVGMYLYFPGDNNTDPYPNPNYAAQTNVTLPPLEATAAHNSSFLENAMREYEWFRTHNFTNAQGLIVDGFHISDGQTTCDQRNEMVYTYNQGVLLSGLRGLWEATGDTSYLADGYSIIDIVINATGWNAPDQATAAQWSGLGRNGILEDYCDANGDCGQDDLIFKGVYFHHFDLFCEPLPTQDALVPGVTKVASTDLAQSHASKCASFAPWVEHNAWAALNTRNSSNIIGEWWGGAYINDTQQPQTRMAVAIPAGSTDIRNQPWLLNSLPWICTNLNLCLGGLLGSVGSILSPQSRRLHARADDSQVRTVETQAQGLSVIISAANLLLKRPSA